jgi:choline kinase
MTPPSPPSPVRQAIILAAGNGDRFRHASPRSKLLASVGGMPLLARTLTSAAAAGITHAHVVLGYDAEHVQRVASDAASDSLRLSFHHNPRWREENGLSLLAARPHARGAFALMMGDHLFDPVVLRRLLATPMAEREALLAVDHGPQPAAVVEEATRVRLHGERVTAIGKSLDPFDALDTGLFVCQASVFDAAEESCTAGDTTLSGGIRRLAERGLIRGIDIGGAAWCDIDTTDDLEAAEHLLDGRVQ